MPVTSVDLVEGTDFDFTTACPANDDVYLHVIDECGNETISSAVQVTVDDDTDPTVATQVPATYSVDGDCEATVSTTDIDDGSSDNCNFVLGISTTGTPGDGGTFASPTTSVTLTEGTDFDFSTASPANDDVYLHVIDECGNETVSSAVHVTIVDDTTPDVQCRDHTLQLDANGNGLLLVGDVDNGSSDNCGTPAMVLDQAIFTCGDLGDHVVTLTVTDAAGNSAPCTATVTVDDSVWPCCPPTNIIYVDANTPDDDDGSDWDNAFATLERALELGSRCGIATEIWVADGTYYPTTGTDRTASFPLVNGLAIYGGFAGGEMALSERDIANNTAILSGDIGTAANSSDNSYHVVYNKKRRHQQYGGTGRLHHCGRQRRPYGRRCQRRRHVHGERIPDRPQLYLQ